MKKQYHKGSLKKLSEEDLQVLTGKHDVEASQKSQDNSFISGDFDVNDLDPSKNIAMGGYYGT